MRLVREGLRAMKAVQHLRVFEAGVHMVEQLGEENLAAYFAADYFGASATRDVLNAPNALFARVSKREDLETFNAARLPGLSHLTVLPEEQMREEVRRRSEALENRECRVTEARANEPRYMKLIRALCQRSSQEWIG